MQQLRAKRKWIDTIIQSSLKMLQQSFANFDRKKMTRKSRDYSDPQLRQAAANSDRSDLWQRLIKIRTIRNRKNVAQGYQID